MTVEEAKGVCKHRSKWKQVISAYPKVCMVVCVVSGTEQMKSLFFSSMIILTCHLALSPQGDSMNIENAK
jgi:hypothetical protein